MEDLLTKLAPLYWTNRGYLNAWRLCFEQDDEKRRLLTLVLRYLPAELGKVEFFEDEPSRQFVVLFTHNHDNVGARLNEAKLLLTLAETKAVLFYGAEGAAGEFNFAPYRTFPDKAITRQVASYLLRSFQIAPIEYVGMTASDPIVPWGIEDRDLYLQAVSTFQGPGYWETINQRAPRMFENLITKMDELRMDIGGACLTDYNFGAGHSWLRERGIAHAGIRAAEFGRTDVGRQDSQIRGEPYDEQEEALQEIFGGRKPRRGWGFLKRRKRSVTITIPSDWGI